MVFRRGFRRTALLTFEYEICSVFPVTFLVSPFFLHRDECEYNMKHMCHLSLILIPSCPNAVIASDVGKAFWYAGGSAGNSTTCVPDGEKWISHRLDFLCVPPPAFSKSNSGGGRYNARVLADLFANLNVYRSVAAKTRGLIPARA